MDGRTLGVLRVASIHKGVQNSDGRDFWTNPTALRAFETILKCAARIFFLADIWAKRRMTMFCLERHVVRCRGSMLHARHPADIAS